MFFCKILWFTWCAPPVYPGCKRLNSTKHIVYYHPAENSVHSVHRCISGVFLRAIREIQGFYRRFLSKNLSKFVKICQNLSKILSKFVKICQNLSKFVKIFQNLSKRIKTRPFFQLCATFYSPWSHDKIHKNTGVYTGCIIGLQPLYHNNCISRK